MKSNNQLLEDIINGIKEKKGINIAVIKLKGIAGAICDYFVICEGNSPTQVSAIATSVERVVKTNSKEDPLRVQGQQLGEWIGIDYGNIIVHIFLPDLRNYYKIEHLWSDAKITKIQTEE